MRDCFHGMRNTISLIGNLILFYLFRMYGLVQIGRFTKSKRYQLNQFYHCCQVAWIPYDPPNLIKIRSLTSSPLLICCAVGDLRTSHHGSYASDLMSYKYMINTVMSLFDQSDGS